MLRERISHEAEIESKNSRNVEERYSGSQIFSPQRESNEAALLALGGSSHQVFFFFPKMYEQAINTLFCEKGKVQAAGDKFDTNMGRQFLYWTHRH